MHASSHQREPSGGAEARRHRRVPFSEIVLITHSDSSNSIPARGEDLGPGGVAVSTDKALAVGTTVSAWISSSSASAGFVRCDGIVRYRQGARHGLEFRGLTPQQAEVLERICQASGARA